MATSKIPRMRGGGEGDISVFDEDAVNDSYKDTDEDSYKYEATNKVIKSCSLLPPTPPLLN